MAAKPVADFSLPATAAGTSGTAGSGTFRLSESLASPRVKSLVLYFYPKDNTPGCTTEGQQFGALHGEFAKAGALVFGVSRDSLKSHQNFKTKMDFPFELLSDAEETACSLFGVIKMKNMYGRQVRGIERSTFVLDSNRVILREWRGVKVPGHAQEVLDFVKTV
jgi:thioredoxin-dependent peroxiredoxin